MGQGKRNVAESDGDQGLIYSSPAIHERRRRILEETRKMIAEHGLAGFSMDEVGKRAGVAKRTLYNAYQTKENMIALAIHEYFERYLQHIPYTGEIGSIQRNVERMIFVIQRNRQLRNYISALMSIYFSADSDSDIWNTMHSMAVESNLQWINGLKSKRQLQPWIDPVRLADDIVRMEYSIINDWCRGKIEDDQVVYHLVRACLTIGAGAARGAGRKEIEDMLTEFHTSGIPLPTLPTARAKKG
ncbi:transcriptional regulator [alpha proteobacterium U9-1i]|nr:transcriptional regulator [alpha proteobacterium U9-1i]